MVSTVRTGDFYYLSLHLCFWEAIVLISLLSGTIGSYQQWADLVDDDSYTFPNLMPYFQKSVNFTPPNQLARASNATPSYDLGSFAPPGQGGPLQVTYPNWANPISSWAARSLLDLGFEEKHSFVDGDLLGWSYAICAQSGKDQTRSSSETSFLREALLQSADNIALYAMTLVRRVLFNGNKAVGLQVTSGTLTTQRTFNITATKEVIVSAGTVRRRTSGPLEHEKGFWLRSM